MIIKKIELKNFRNYFDESISFNNNVNLVLGNNAQGKTNLIEAIYLCSLGKSFRTNNDKELINFKEDYSIIKLEYEKNEEVYKIEIILSSDGRKSIKIDGAKLRKTSELLNNIYTVIFSPEDLRIVKDEPEKRRKFIDRELCQLKPSYYNNLVNYKKTLLQRNTYLKESKIDFDMLDIWDKQLAHYGTNIIYQRNEFIIKLSGISNEIHKEITNNSEFLKMKYSPNIILDENIKPNKNEKVYYNIIKESIDNDLRMRTTTKGPHKDDLIFLVNDVNIRNYGSQGQQRTGALSLKLAELKLIKSETGEDAVLLLDDVLSELDIKRQKYLIKSLSRIQLFITTTEISDELRKSLDCSSEYYIENGKIIIKK